MKHTATWNKTFSFAFIKKAIHFFLLHLSKTFIIPPSLRPRLLSLCGVRFSNAESVFIGTDVLFDNLKDTKTFIGKNVTITTGVKILNHFPIISKGGITEFSMGNVTIEDDVFIGMNSLIIKPITIGKGAIIGAGAVVTRDVPAGAIVTGNPAEVTGYIEK